MKGQLRKTKVVVRHLPPTISQAMLTEQIDVAFSGRYNWVSFRPGKASAKHQSYSRAYIDFKSTEDVIGFAEFFNGHLFVNEKGTQFKAAVEYAPSQRVPKQWLKSDAREGTIFIDPEYLEFLQSIAKPAESLPSADIQLERREAERAGAPKDAPIVTPLMDFVRQKRAAKNESRRISSNGKLSRRVGASGSTGISSPKRGLEKKKVSMKMYVLRGKNNVGKDNLPNVLVSKRDDQQLSDKAVTLASVSGTELLESKNGLSGAEEAGTKKILLLKGKEKEISSQQIVTSSEKNASTLKQNHREGGARLIKSILLHKDSHQSSGVQSEHQIRITNLERDKRPPRPPRYQLSLKDPNIASDDKPLGHDMSRFSSEKLEKRTRNKERPDRVVWTPLRRSDGSYASDEALSSSTQSTQSSADGSQGVYGDGRLDIPNSRGGEPKTFGSGRGTHPTLENGSHKHFGRRGLSHNLRETDGSYLDGKPIKRSGASVYGSHEKQVWVQKSSSGS